MSEEVKALGEVVPFGPSTTPAGVGMAKKSPAEEELELARATLKRLFKPYKAPRQKPPPRPWLVWLGDMLGGPGKWDGIIPQGEVGLFVGAGGAGKSFSLIHLAVAIATGKPWFGCRLRQGRALLVLAEEGELTVDQRMWAVFEMMKLEPEDFDAVEKNLVVFAASGENMRLTKALIDSPGRLPSTALADELQALMRDSGPWSFIGLDPVARVGGADVEIDNAAATALVQVSETFKTLPGNPTVALVHHTNKTSRKATVGHTTEADAASDLRGATGLSDGARWQFNLTARARFDGTCHLIQLRMVKASYGPLADEMTLAQPRGGDGALRVATDEEIQQWDEAERASEHAKKQGSTTKKNVAAPNELKVPTQKSSWIPD